MTSETVIKDTSACVRSCPIAARDSIRIDGTLWHRLVSLASVEKEEWLAFLLGDYPSRRVDSFYFPRQTRSSTSCDAFQGEILPGTIGMIHSHHTMKAFFSSTDWDNMNGKLEIVINASGDYEANVLTQLECGRWGRVPALVIMTGVVEEDLVQLRSAIVKPPPPPVAQIVNPYDWHRADAYSCDSCRMPNAHLTHKLGQWLCSDCLRSIPNESHEVVESINQPLATYRGSRNGNGTGKLSRRERKRLIQSMPLVCP